MAAPSPWPDESGSHPLRHTLRELLEWRNIALPLAALAILFGISRWHYLAFHSLAELFAVVIAIVTSAVAWYTYRFTRNHLFMFLGAGMFWIGILDLLHTLTFRGMPEAFGASANLTAQFWIATRYLEALLLLATPSFHRRPVLRLPLFLLFGGLALLASAAIAGGLFPDAYVEGQGLTPFKVGSEYLIILLLLLAILRFRRIRAATGARLYHFMVAALGFTIVSEFCFTLYIDLYGLFNLLGHLCKIASYWLLFLGVVRMPLEELLASAERSRESERRYRQLFTHCKAVELLVDPLDGRIVDANRAAADYYGWSIGQLREMNIADINTLTPQEIAAELAQAAQEVRSHFNFRHRLANGEEREVEVHSGPIELEGRQILYSIIHDITARRRAEAELIRARQTAESANRAKSAFLAAMSHELRTPLNAILGFAQLLERDQRLNEEQRHQAAVIHRSGNFLLSLIAEVLDLAKIEAGRLELSPSPCDLPALLRGVAEMAGVRAAEKGLELRFTPHPTVGSVVEVDEQRLRQILTNLLGNAVKFTPAGFVALRAQLEPVQTGQRRLLHLEVEDSGVGIPAEEQTLIFEPFYQVKGDPRLKAQGTGLGLAIVRHLVRLLGGSIQLESKPGEGTLFQLEIPVTRLGDSAFRIAPRLAGEVGGYRRLRGEGAFELLVVDDAADNRELLVSLLRPLGFRLREAADGQGCLDAVQERLPDAILLDLRMPGLDGFTTARVLRADPAARAIPLLAISAGALAEERTQALEAGCDAFLAKPVQLDELLELLGQSLPLSWTRTEPQGQPIDPEPLPERGSPSERAFGSGEIPPHTAQALRQALKRGDVGALRSLLEPLALAPDAPPLAVELLALARSFRLKDMQRRLARISHRAP